MSKYFDTKPGSLEEAVSAAQQAAIAISKKEKGEKPKEENNFIYAAKMAKKNGEKTFTIGSKEYDVEEALKSETNKNDKSDDGDGLDAVQPKAVKKKFADRKDKDIDNDGDVDSSDKFLHKRRKAISKAVGEEVSLEETVSIIESTSFSVLGILTEADKKAIKRALDAAREKENKLKKRMGDAERMGKPELADKFAQQASDAEDDVRDLEKQFRNADEDDIETASQKGVLGKKGTSAKSKEKDRRKDVAFDAGPGKEKGSVAGVDRNIKKVGGAYDNYVQGQREKGQRPLSKADYMKRFGSRLKREDFETDLEFEAHLIELNRTMTPLKDTILNMWKEAQDMEQDKDGDGMDDDQKPKKSKEKTDSGKDMTEIETSVKMPKMKNEKNKV